MLLRKLFNLRVAFILHMIVYMMAISFTLITLKARYYTQCIVYALFVYIIVKACLDEYHLEKRRKKARVDAANRRIIMDKLTALIQDVKGTV